MGLKISTYSKALLLGVHFMFICMISLGMECRDFALFKSTLSTEQIKQGFQLILSQRDKVKTPISFLVKIEDTETRITTTTILGMIKSSLGILRSSNRVWLGHDEAGRQMIVKQLSEFSDDWIQQYEVLVTEFYLQNHIRVPRILAYDPIQKIILKEYFEGVIPLELELNSKHLLGSTTELKLALEALASEKSP
jgi:hypothetical protein